MKLAHIVPVSLLSTVPNEQSLHLVLSELVLSDERYFRFYAERKNAGDFIILDNPVHEDRPVKFEHWIEAIMLLQPNVAVVPDVIDSTLMTLDNAREAVARFREYHFPQTELMAVPHSQTQYGWLQCATELARLGDPLRWFGISLERRLDNDPLALIRRRERVDMMLSFPERFGHIKLHLLGVSERGDELGNDSIWQRAHSADSSKFAVWSMLGTPVSPPVPILQPYPGRGTFGGSYEYFLAGHPQGLSRRKMLRNLRQWNEYAESEKD
ncbi:MAG TPA: hypothetical protein VGR71_16995 [Nitrospira sp.]|nr:hypothetical protein [Nitrospira sp.]